MLQVLRELQREQEAEEHCKLQEREQEAEEHCKLQELEQRHLGAGCPVPRSKRVQRCTNGH